MIHNDRCFLRFCYGIACVLVAISLFPFLYIFFVSISDSAAIAAGNLLSAENELSLDSYIGLFLYGELGNSFLNSIKLSLIGVALNMAFTVPCSYALSRKETRGKAWIYSFLTFSMFFRGEIIPSYVWMSELGIIDSYFAVWLSKLVSIYNIFILAQFFESLPQNVLDAAKLDGAGPLQIMFRIVLPMSKAALCSIGIMYFATWWNDYYYTMIYIRDPKKATLPLRIIQMISNIEDSSVYSAQDMVYAKLSAYGVRAAGIVLSILPMLLMILVVQHKNVGVDQIYKKQQKEKM